jgi:phospholipid transport system substrate-binding protein
VTLVLFTSSAYAEDITATSLVKKFEASVQSKTKVSIDSLIDFEKISQDSLGVNWVTATPAQRDEFSSLFRGLIQKSYERNLKHAKGYTIEWLGEVKVDGGALVKTKVVKKDSHDEPLFVDYKVSNSRIVDIITEDSSMVDRYRKQFRRIILKEGFEGLLEKMRKKSIKDDK